MDKSNPPQLTIDREFRDLIRPLMKDEYRYLESNLVADGCRDPIIVWKGVIVDGHNRYEICTRLGIPFEVSSPGLDRPLKKEKDFARSIGKDVEIKLYKALNKEKEFVGVLTDYDKETITIELDDESIMVFDRSDVALIRLAFFY